MSQKWRTMLGVSLGALCPPIGVSTISIGLPVIAAALHQPVTSAEWVIVIYTLVITSLLMTFGRLGDLISTKLLYVVGFIVFTLGALASGLSPSFGWLLASRAVQGLGGAIRYPRCPHRFARPVLPAARFEPGPNLGIILAPNHWTAARERRARHRLRPLGAARRGADGRPLDVQRPAILGGARQQCAGLPRHLHAQPAGPLLPDPRPGFRLLPRRNPADAGPGGDGRVCSHQWLAL